MSKKKRYIVHVDMDAFFASIEEYNDPSTCGKPIVVGSDPKGGKGRGVVAACSYAARKFGIHSAMPISVAYRKCPQAVFLRPDMKKYATISRKIFGVLETFTPEIEPISIDEAFMDITGSYHLFGSPAETCYKIKNAVKKETGLTASVGLAPNMMAAKIASDINKPDGFMNVYETGLLNFLHPLPVGKLWGIGEKTVTMLTQMGITTIGDLAHKDIQKLERIFGKNGIYAWNLANGIDPREVETTGVVRSIGNEHTFDTDTKNIHEIKDVLMFLSEKVSGRLRRSEFKGKTITLKIRFSDFKTYSRSTTLAVPTNFADMIYENILKMTGSFNMKNRSIRLLGVRVSKLIDHSVQTDLFDGKSAKTAKRERIHKALDRIVNKFGEGSIGRR